MKHISRVLFCATAETFWHLDIDHLVNARLRKRLHCIDMIGFEVFVGDACKQCPEAYPRQCSSEDLVVVTPFLLRVSACNELRFDYLDASVIVVLDREYPTRLENMRAGWPSNDRSCLVRHLTCNLFLHGFSEQLPMRVLLSLRNRGWELA